MLLSTDTTEKLEMFQNTWSTMKKLNKTTSVVHLK